MNSSKVAEYKVNIQKLVAFLVITIRKTKRKKKWNLAICGNMDGPEWYYMKWNKSDRGKQILCDFIYI